MTEHSVQLTTLIVDATPTVAVITGIAMFLFGAFAIVLRRPLRDWIVKAQSASFGERVGRRVQSTPTWGFVVAGAIFAGIGVLIIFLNTIPR